METYGIILLVSFVIFLLYIVGLVLYAISTDYVPHCDSCGDILTECKCVLCPFCGEKHERLRDITACGKENHE